MNPRLAWLCHALCLLSICAPMFAQAPATLSGCVEDSTKAIVPGATIILRNPETGSRFQAQTDESGCFAIRGAASGRYELQVLAQGFAPYERETAFEDAAPITVSLDVRPLRETVLVTATRGPVSSTALGSSVDVVGQPEIQASTLPAAVDLLRNVASVNVTRTGNIGGLTSLFVRGGESDYTKVLVDGVPMNQPGGIYDFSHLMAGNISRIEVVRGPQSALFGSDAISGVIQVFTRPGTSTPEFDYSAEGGSFDTFQQQAAMRAGWRKMDISSTFSRLDTDNVGRNNDYRNATFATNAGFSPDSNNSFRLTLLHGSVKAGAPGVNAPGFTSFGPNNRMSRLERDAGLSYRGLAGPRVTQNAAYRIYDHDQNFFSAFGVSTVFHTRHRAEYSGDVAVSDSALFSYGIDYDRQNALVATARHSRSNAGYYLQQQAAFLGRFDMTGGVRIDDNTTFGVSANPRIAVSFRATPETRFRFSAGSGIKEPSFIENFSQSSFFLGNPDLLAERSRSWEAGAEQLLWNGLATVDLTWFDNRFSNMIQLVRRPDGSSRYENIGRASPRGLETRIRSRWRELSVQANYTFLEGAIRESMQTSFPFREGDALLRRPKHSADLTAIWYGSQWTAYWSTKFAGRRTDSDFFAASTPLFTNPSYIVSDAAFTYEFSRHFSAFVRVENVFDRNYQEVLGYQALGRSAVVGTRIHLGRER